MTTPFRNPPRPSRRALPLYALLFAALIAAWSTTSQTAAQGVMLAGPASDSVAVPGSTTQTAVLAGGCFWGVQGVFQQVHGVTQAVSGYAGGSAKTANYELVGSGTTGHAEAVRISFDPQKISYGRLLHIYFSVAHNPTELNRQGPDRGTQYRSTIFPINDEQARVARSYIEQLNRSKAFDKELATTVEPHTDFYTAENYHQDFLTRNPRHPYIVVHDLPKIGELKRLFPNAYSATPMLVGSTPPQRHTARAGL